jgi:hypothetical protein
MPHAPEERDLRISNERLPLRWVCCFVGVLHTLET